MKFENNFTSFLSKVKELSWPKGPRNNLILDKTLLFPSDRLSFLKGVIKVIASLHPTPLNENCAHDEPNRIAIRNKTKQQSLQKQWMTICNTMLMIMNNKARACILMNIKTKGALQKLFATCKERQCEKREIKLFELLN